MNSRPPVLTDARTGSGRCCRGRAPPDSKDAEPGGCAPPPAAGEDCGLSGRVWAGSLCDPAPSMRTSASLPVAGPALFTMSRTARLQAAGPDQELRQCPSESDGVDSVEMFPVGTRETGERRDIAEVDLQGARGGRQPVPILRAREVPLLLPGRPARHGHEEKDHAAAPALDGADRGREPAEKFLALGLAGGQRARRLGPFLFRVRILGPEF